MRHELVPQIDIGICAKLKRAILATIVAAVLMSAASVANAGSQFATGDCTWFVDMVTEAQGWKLKFNQNSNRDAYKWTDMVTNGRIVSKPQLDSIVVLGPGPSVGNLGHVGWIVTVKGDTFGVVHVKWVGKEIGKLDGIPFKYTVFKLGPPGQITMIEPAGRSYPLKGFIARK